MKKNEVQVEVPVVEETTTKKSFHLPYKVKCSVCGKEKAVRQEVLLKRLVGFKGTLEERFNAHILIYKCQECKRDAKMKEIEASLPEVKEEVTE